jgi:endonuclease/exonuclease/phosphatase family metal-dependent hydrolase
VRTVRGIEAVMGEFTVATINVHMGVPDGMDLLPANERRAAVCDVAAFLLDRDVDAVLLQEVRDDAPGARPGGVPGQLGLLCERIEAADVAFHATVASGAGDRYGLCMATRRDRHLLDVRRRELPHGPGRELRIVQLARLVLADDGAACTIGNVHLDHTGLDRPAQIEALDQVLSDAARDLPLVIGGDFNDAAEVVARGVRGAGLVNVVDGLEPGDPLRRDTHVRAGRIDHLLLSPTVRLVEQDLVEVPMRELRDGQGVTDHLALVARVEVAA